MKAIAILFLLLLCLTSITGATRSGNNGYELQTTCEDTEKENKEGKKEIKEFTADTHRKAFAAHRPPCSYNIPETFAFPHPVVHRETPPPDPAC